MPDPVVAIAYRSALEVISAAEPDVAKAIVGELESQRRQLKLIASENYASPAVLLAMGNWLSDKYAEGIPGHRFYAGCEMVDRIETLATGHAKALFGAEHAYVQPHSGIDANLVAYWAILAHRVEQPFLDEAGVGHVNDLDPVSWDQLRNELHSQRMMGMALDAGGHLTHGFRPNISGKLFDQASYGVDVHLRTPRLRRHRRSGEGVPSAGARGGVLGLPPESQFRDPGRDRPRRRGYLHGRHGPLRWAGGRESAGR